MTFVSTRMPPLAAMPALPFQLPNVRTTLLEGAGQGLNVMQAYARAQALTDRSMDSVVTVEGELDALRYGDLLTGFTYDGLYYVKSVNHTITKGQYKQRFTLTREGTGSLTPVVIP